MSSDLNPDQPITRRVWALQAAAPGPRHIVDTDQRVHYTVEVKMNEESPALLRQGAAIDRTVGAVGGALLGVLTVAATGPDGATVAPGIATVSAPWIEELSYLSRTAIARRATRAQDAIRAACDVARTEPPELLQQVLDDDVLTELTARVIEAAAASTFDSKVKALGQALGHAATAPDQARVDTEYLFVNAISEIETAHLRLLLVLKNEAGHKQIPRVLEPGTPEHERYRYGWTPERIATVDPGIGEVIEILAAQLTASGLIERPTGQTFPAKGIAITPFGRRCLERLEELS